MRNLLGVWSCEYDFDLFCLRFMFYNAYGHFFVLRDLMTRESAGLIIKSDILKYMKRTTFVILTILFKIINTRYLFVNDPAFII